MDQQKIDRLFREKLGHMEVEPSIKSWSQVEKQIRPKRTPIVYWVAASVSLLFISWIVWPEQSQRDLTTVAAVEVNYPINQAIPEFVLPEIIVEEEEEVEVIPVKKLQPKTQALPQFAVNEKVDEEVEIKKEMVPELEGIDTQTAVAEAEIEAPVIKKEVKKAVEQPAFRAVKITYIASASTVPTAEDTQKSDSTGVLKKFIAFTEKIAPGDMLADIKTAKDNLLNGGLKNKKDRSSL